MDPTEDFTLWKDILKIVSATLNEKIPHVEQEMGDEYDLSSLMSGPRTKNAIKGHHWQRWSRAISGVSRAMQRHLVSGIEMV